MLHDQFMASQHLQGALHIIEAAGGVEALGLGDLASFLLYSCIYGKRLLDGTEKAPANMPLW